jgi:hypothetical protein
LDVGKVILDEPLERNRLESGTQMSQNVTVGVYRATMVSFASGISRTFKDELKIDVSKAA